MKIILKGRIPSKKNSRNIFKTRGRSGNTPSDKYKQWHKIAALEILSQYASFKVIENIYQIEINFWMPDNRVADLTNKAESVMDLLCDCHVIEDDRWQIIPCILLHCEGIDRKNPRAEIWIKTKNED